MMSGPVFAHQPGAIYSEDNRQILQGYVMNDLIIGPLKKGRIYCHYRP